MQDEKLICEFCGADIQFHEVNLGRRAYRMSPKHCTCEQAIKFWTAEFEKEQAERETKEKVEREAYIERLFDESQLPSKWRDRTFEKYDSSVNGQAMEIAQKFAKNFSTERGNGLIFTGPVGLGKTHLVAAISMELLSRQYRVIFGTIGTLLAQLRNTYGNKKETEREVFERLTKCHLLIIDDLGKEKVSDWVAQMVYEIINTRYDDNKSTIITTNMKLSQIRDKYNKADESQVGDAIVSRIVGMCEGVQMAGKDWRKKSVMKESNS